MLFRLITVVLPLLMLSFCLMDVDGKPLFKDQNEIIISAKRTHGRTIQSVHDQRFAKGRTDYFALKKHHWHDNEFPPFDVIRCVVEEMSRRKVNQLSSVEDDICNLRHKRHHHRMERIDSRPMKRRNSTDQTLDNTQTENIHKYNSRTAPQRKDNCSAISAFLSNSTNLNHVYKKAKDLACIKGDMSNMFEKFTQLANTSIIGKGHRLSIVRKWRHLGCRLYREFINCTKAFASRNDTTSLSAGDNGTLINKQTNIDGSSLEPADKEAVHVSDSSHIDFLNFMIGYQFDEDNDYQMWFY